MAVSNSASDVLVSHHSKICKVLATSESTLLSLTIELYEKEVVDIQTKSHIRSKSGLEAADSLLDFIRMRVDNEPKILQIVFKAMQENVSLKDIVDQMKSWKRDMQGKMLFTALCTFHYRIIIILLYVTIILFISREEI